MKHIPSRPDFLDKWNLGNLPSSGHRKPVTVRSVSYLAYGPNRTDHDQEIISIYNPTFGGRGKVRCDKGVVSLVKVLNSCGILTIRSCQGETRESRKPNAGYIVVRVKDPVKIWDAARIVADFWEDRYVTMLLHPENLGEIIFQAAWRKKDLHDIFYLLPTKRFQDLLRKRSRK